MKATDLKEGNSIILDSGFTCRGPGVAEVEKDEHGFFFRCAGHLDDVAAHEQGTDTQVDPSLLLSKHYLDGQEGEDGELIGVTPNLDDATVILAALIKGQIKIETLSPGIVEIEIDGLQYCCRLDQHGTPVVHEVVRAAIAAGHW